MDMLRRNLKRHASRPISPFSSPRSTDQENVHPNLARSSASSPRPAAKNPSEESVAPPPTGAATDHAAAAPHEDEASVKVAVRVRPVATGAVDSKNLWFVRKTSTDSVAVGDRTFAFDSVLGAEASQGEVFELVGAPLVATSLAGFNTSLVCYGQSGTGKTHTMWGPIAAMVDGCSAHADQGIVPRVFQSLFSEIQSRQDSSGEKQTSYQCRCSFLEIYNEQINDLLDPTHRDLQIRDNAGNGIHVENLTDEYVSTVEDVNQILMKGLSNRKVGTTSMNLKSSRSHVLFTCIIESWSKGFSSNGFSSSRTSRITFVDLAGPDNDELDDDGKHCTKEERHVKKSLLKLGKLVNILSEAADPEKNSEFPYKNSRLTHLLKDTLGGNSKVTFLCTISSEHRYRSGTLSTLRFGERAKLIQNRAVINEITEDDVNGLSDQIRQLKEELIRTKSGGNTTSKTGYFSAQNARESLHNLRVSLNRSLILPHIEVDEKEEMDVDEEDVRELCSQISKLHSSSEDTFDDFMDAESSPCDTPHTKSNLKMGEDGDQPIIDSGEGPIQEEHHEVPDNANADQDQDSVRKSSLSISACQQLSPIQDPTLCSSPKIHSKTRKSITSPGLSASKLSIPDRLAETNVEASRKSAVRSSLQSSKLSPTESLAVSLHRGLHIIEYHQQNPAPRKSFVGLSFDHFALNPRQSIANASSAVQALPNGQGGGSSTLCSSCKKVMGGVNGHQRENINPDTQIVLADGAESKASLKDDNNISATASKREAELESLCEEQAAKIKQLSTLVDQYKNVSEDIQASDGVTLEKELTEGGKTQCDDGKVSFSMNERESLLTEIQRLKDQLKHYTDESTNNCLLEQIRNGSTEQAGYELEKERQKWTESESKWISLTEELRIDLESNRMLAEKTEMELSMEKKCTAELDDALHRAIHGHARIVEHYAELQEMYNDLLEKHRRVMEGISEVKRAAAKAGRKGCGTAFAAALAAELSTLRIDREKERAYLKEQNRRLRIQLRDTAEAVHAAGELLVRLREAEEASAQEKEMSAAMQQENEKLRKQIENMRKKHDMEMETMKHYLAESRLPESALGPFYHRDSEEVVEDYRAPTTCDDDQSWRAAFTAAYQ